MPDYTFEIQFFENIYRRNPSDPRVVEILGHLYTRQNRIDDGLRMDRRMVRLRPEDPLSHYNLACSLALKQRKRDAINSLRRAVELGYRNADWLLEDPDLEELRGEPAFEALLSEIQ